MNDAEENERSGELGGGTRRGLARAATGASRRVMAASRRVRLGRVVRLFVDGGFGFVRTHDGVMAYFAADDVAGGAFASLVVGARVRFEVGGDGTPHAVDVAPA